MKFVSAIHRAAVLVKTLPQRQAGSLLSRLTATDLQALFKRIRSLGNISEAQKKAAIRQFLKSAEDIQRRPAEFPRSEHGQAGNASGSSASGPFSFLAEAEDTVRYRVLASEHPRVIAIVLTSLPASQAAATLNQFESEIRVNILRRLCELETVDHEEAAQLSRQLQERLQEVTHNVAGPAGGISTARRMLSCTDPVDRESILEGLQQRDPVLASNLRSRLFQFDDLARLSDPDIRIILKRLDTSLWAPALKNAPLSIRKKVLLNMAAQPREILNREMRSIRRIDDYIRSAARSQIVAGCLDLADRKLISLPTDLC